MMKSYNDSIWHWFLFHENRKDPADLFSKSSILSGGNILNHHLTYSIHLNKNTIPQCNSFIANIPQNHIELFSQY